MPRRPRELIEGGIYHVYNRAASGEDIFSDPETAIEFLDRVSEVKQRDGLTVFAWTLMSNHYHLAIRTSAVPLSRSMHSIQSSFGHRFNGRLCRTGGVWQSRYQAKPIDEQAYLDRVILYIHLNPVAGGLVSNPADHVFSGHREIVKRVSAPLIDVDVALLSFGETERASRKSYLSAIRFGCRELGKEVRAGDETAGIWLRKDRMLAPDETGPYVDVLGRSTGPERAELTAEDFVNRCAALLDVEPGELASRSRIRRVVEARRLVVSLGRERWGQSTNKLGLVLDKSADTVSYLGREGVKHRLEDEGFADRYEVLDAEMVERHKQTTAVANDPR